MAKPLQQAKDPGASLLKRQFSDLDRSPTVMRSADAFPARAKKANMSSEQRITRYLERLERVISLKPENPESGGYSRLQQRLCKQAVIDITDQGLVEKIAHGIFTSEKRAALERGHAPHTLEIPFDQFKQDYIKLVHEKHATQLMSLSRWTDYLFKNDALHPAWFRYLAIRSVLKMGDFDRGTPKFGNRTKDTIAAFPELNSEALGFVYKVLSDPSSTTLNTDSLLLPFRAAVASKNFSALYAVALVECNQRIDRTRLEGEWRKYDKGSDYTVLEGDLSGKGTSWCTASGSAKSHLDGGDFYVYYTKDDKGSHSVPRVAIRMHNDEIVEIRGIAPGQELEPEFVEVVEEKGKTLSGFDRFQKASADMKLLKAIDKRCFVRDAEGKIQATLTPDPLLTKDELRFLYELDSEISSFGYQSDPRINEIRDARDTRRDYATMYDIEIAQVAANKGDINADTRVYLGDRGEAGWHLYTLTPRCQPKVPVRDVPLQSEEPLREVGLQVP